MDIRVGAVNKVEQVRQLQFDTFDPTTHLRPKARPQSQRQTTEQEMFARAFG